jgi:hypothetical protein
MDFDSEDIFFLIFSFQVQEEVGDAFSKDHSHSDVCNNHSSADIGTKRIQFFIFAFIFAKILRSSSPMAKNSQMN